MSKSWNSDHTQADKKTMKEEGEEGEEEEEEEDGIDKICDKKSVQSPEKLSSCCLSPSPVTSGGEEELLITSIKLHVKCAQLRQSRRLAQLEFNSKCDWRLDGGVGGGEGFISLYCCVCVTTLLGQR